MGSLTGQNLYDLTTKFLHGYAMDSTEFYQRLAASQAKFELMRAWAILTKKDTTQVANVSDVYTTAKNLPADFLSWVEDIPVILLNPSDANDYVVLEEIPYGTEDFQQSEPNKYYCDYTNSHLYLCGKVDKARTIRQNYLYKPADVIATTSWVFPSWTHMMLALDIVLNYKGSEDFDEISKAEAAAHKAEVDQIWELMVNWDSRLQEQRLKGLDRHYNSGLSWTPGKININR